MEPDEMSTIHIGQFRPISWNFFGEDGAVRWEWDCSCGASARTFWKREARRIADEHEELMAQ
jgi:hypothetical protein